MNIRFRFISLLIILVVFHPGGYSQKIEEIQIVDTTLNKVDSIQGNIVTIQWQSHFLNEERSITVYQPPQYERKTDYGVLFVTDEMAQYLATYVEYLILNDEIEPIIIVGLNYRKEQPEDSLIAQYGFDFRSMEYHKTSEIFSEIPIADSLVPVNMRNRYDRFVSFVQFEVINYVYEHYNLSNNKDRWTIGGFSNGGGFAMYITQDYPSLFGNAIVLSPADLTPLWMKYNFTEQSPMYYFAAGTKENNSFLWMSLRYVEQLEEKKLPYIHYTYDAGHDFYMWIDAYVKAIKLIYEKE